MVFQKIKSFLFHFFHFNKQERNGVFVLSVIIVILFVVRLIIPLLNNDTNTVQFITINSSVTKGDNLPIKNNSAIVDSPIKISNKRFVFNPNTITEEDAQKLGLSKKLSSTLINFRNKGGKFYKPEDLKKLYGLSPELYKELEHYVLIPNSKHELKKDTVYSDRSYEKKGYTKIVVEINTADSLSIVYLKGIGPGFTKRIMKYRSMLGGFHSLNQLKEVYGMTDSTFALLSSQIKIDEQSITKIPINVIDFNTLRKHPYFNFQSAQAVINFRFKHGKLTEEDVKALGVFSEEKLRLILPYLSY